MSLKMPSPIKHPKSGIYHIRVRVPADLVHEVGRKEVGKSLRTRDITEAKSKFATELAAYHKRWASLRSKPAPLPYKQIVALAGRTYHRMMVALEAEPGEPEMWENVKGLNQRLDESEDKLETWYGPSVDELLEEEGLVVDDYTRTRLLAEVRNAWVQLTEQQHKRSRGDFSPDPNANRFPKWEPENKPEPSPSGATVSQLFEVWERDHLANGKSSATARDFKHKLSSLSDFIGHEVVSEISPRQIVEWTDWLRLEKGLSPRTVSMKYLAAVKAVFRLGRGKFLIADDPSQSVSVKVPPKTKSRSSGYTEDEAKTILRAANTVLTNGPEMSYHNKLACRWVPWICAYTGARSGEITQLRKEDVKSVGGIPQLTISPEAGTQKAGRFRIVPIHPHLVEVGFLRFVDEADAGYLFHEGARTQEEAVRRAGNARDKVAGWIKNNSGIDLKGLQPNHAWRHRFKTVGRNADIAVDYLEAIQGHAGRTAGDGYGEYTIETLYREICKIPRITVV